VKRTLVAALAVLAAGCAAESEAGEEAEVQAGAEAGAGGGAASAGATAAADLIDAQGRNVGRVVLTDAGGGLEVEVQVEGIPPGEHAIHLHQVGACTPPDFLSTGGHFNPSGRTHGLENPEGPHDGDMRNIEVDASGSGRFALENERVTLDAFLDADGGSVIIHAGPDDYRTGPTGEGGQARIVCGVFDR